MSHLNAQKLAERALKMASARASKTAFAFFNKQGQYVRVSHSQLKPHLKENGGFKKPALSGLDIARLRKQAREANAIVVYPSADANSTQPTFTLESKPWNNREVVYKGQKHAMKRQAKYDLIEKNMEEMKGKIEEYYKAQKLRRHHLDDPVYILNNGFSKRVK